MAVKVGYSAFRQVRPGYLKGFTHTEVYKAENFGVRYRSQRSTYYPPINMSLCGKCISGTESPLVLVTKRWVINRCDLTVLHWQAFVTRVLPKVCRKECTLGRSISRLLCHRQIRGHQRHQDLRRNPHRRLPQGQGHPLIARRLRYRPHQRQGVSYLFISTQIQKR